MTETGSIHAPSQGGTTTDDDRPADSGADHETAPGLWDAPGDNHNAGSGPAANQAESPGETHPNGEDYRTAGQHGAEPTRKPFRPLRLTPYDDNGNKIAGWGRRIGAFAIDWGSLTVIELIFLVVYGFAGVGKIATFLDAAVCTAYFTLSVGGAEVLTAWLAPVLHAAALKRADMMQVCKWVWSHELREVQAIISASGSWIAGASLSGIEQTDERERSGILSTAAGLLSAYRNAHVLEAACTPNFDPDHFAASYDTVYVTAPADKQDQFAPLIVALLDQIKNAVYRRHNRFPEAAPVVFALDEAANIAPLPKLPQIASEGGGQGLVLLAAMQDISQARFRWGEQAKGFFTLFPVKVFFPGIADAETLELISQLGGEVQVPMVSTSTPPPLAALTGKAFPTTTYSYTWRRRLPVDAVSEGTRGTALCHVSGQPLSHLMTLPWNQVPEWSRRGSP